MGKLNQATETLRGNSHPQAASLYDFKYDTQGSVLKFQAALQSFYLVQRASTFAGPWTNLGIVSTDNLGAAEWWDSAAADPQAFYRIVSLLGN